MPTTTAPKTYTIKFLTNFGPYNAGERAGFDAATCEKYVNRLKVAVFVQTPDYRDAPVDLTNDPTDEIAVSYDTHMRTVKEIEALVESIHDVGQLEALLRGETVNPHHEGGRSTALSVINGRIEALRAG